MRTGFLCAVLTAAIAVGCGSEETKRELTFFALKDGKPQAVRTVMLPSEDIARFREAASTRNPAVMKGLESLREAAAFIGYTYTWDCAGEMPAVIFGKEVKLCAGGCTSVHFAPTACRGWGAGGYDLMGGGLDSWTWPANAWSQHYGPVGGQYMHNYRPSSFICMGADSQGGTHHSECEFYTNTQNGGCVAYQGGASCPNPDVGIASVRADNFTDATRPGSFEFVRFCSASSPC